MEAEININGAISVLTGDFPVGDVREATSYPSEGAMYSKAYQKGVWDGRIHLFKHKTGKFPTGLLSLVKGVLDTEGIPFKVIDNRPEPEPAEDGFDLEGISMTGKWSYQLESCETMVREKQGVVKVATAGGKTEIACGTTKYLGLKTLFIVTTVELLYQAQARFMKRLGVGESEIGILGDGVWKPGSWVNIAIMDTLVSRAKTPACQKILREAEVLFIDEAHHAGSDTWFSVLEQCTARYRFALSGTPLDRTDGADMRLIGTTGEKIIDISNKMLADLGVTAKTDIIWDKITTPMLRKRIKYPTAYKEGIVLNDELLGKIVEWTMIFHALGLQTLILAEEIEQGRRIDDALWNNTGGIFIPHQFIYGDESSATRKSALDDFANKTLPVLVSSRILDEGVDVPAIDALILGGSRKSKIKTMQRLGRGLRGDRLIAVEFSNFTHRFLLEHSLQRYEDYIAEECFPVHQSKPSLELVSALLRKAA